MHQLTRQTATMARRTYVVDHYRPGLKDDDLPHLAERVRGVVVEMSRAGLPISPRA